MKNTSEQWFIEKGEFATQANKSDYNVPLANYAKAITVEWINPYAPTEPGTEVQIVNLHSLDQVPMNRYRSINTDNVPNAPMHDIAHAIAFTGMPPNLMARIVPQPKELGRYRVYFIPSNTDVTDIHGDLLFPEEFINLLIFATANSLLANCKYPLDIYNGFRSGIASDLAMAKANFTAFIGQNKKQSPRSSRGYMPPNSGYRRN